MKNKACSFLKKRTKKLLPVASNQMSALGTRALPRRAKVFCFFFSKKNSFLPFLLLSGCNLAPDYHRPALAVAPTYPDGPAYHAGGDTKPAQLRPAPQTAWQDVYTDPRLRALIDIALRNNRDLRTATLNVMAAQAQYRSERADLFPQINLSGTGTFEGLPNSTTIPTSTSSSGTSGTLAATSSSSLQATPSSGGTYRYYTAGVGFSSYELDLFGQVRNLTAQKFEQYLGYGATARSTQISLIAQVASAYLTLLADQQLHDLTARTLQSQQDSYNLTAKELDRGTTTRLTLRQAETSVDTARANLAQYSRQVAQDQNALVLLLGQPMPADLPPGRKLDDQTILADLPPGLPSDLLTRRPDVVAAEYDLRAANANVGAARAAFFPSITLTAQDGVASNKLSHLFTAGATSWTFSPQLNIPIFTWGQNQANLDLAKVQKNLQVANYEKTVQTAFREVADVLAARGTYLDQLRAQQQLVDADADAYNLALLRFRAGVDNYLATLDSQRSLYAAQQDLVTLRESQLTNLVTTYKVLGGGWSGDVQSAAAPMRLSDN
jgi:multidrug efflux system outer membrane protein